MPKDYSDINELDWNKGIRLQFNIA